MSADNVMTATWICPNIPAIQNPGGISLFSMMSDIDRVGNSNPASPGEWCF